MAVRLDLAGYRKLLDPVGAGGSGGGVPVYDDGTRREPWEGSPWGSKSDAIASEALRLMAIPAEQIRQTRPPVPYMLFPPENVVYDHAPATIEDVLDIDRWAPQQRSWASPTVKIVPRRGEETGVGSARNVSVSMSPMG